MESVALSITVSPPILRAASSSAGALGFIPRTIGSPTLLNTTTSKRSMVFRAQKYEGEPKRDFSPMTPSPKQSDPHRMKAFFETYRYEPSPLKIEEKADAMEMWVKMPGVGVMDIYVYVKDNKLFIQERNDITPFRRMMIQPFESIQLPPDCKKEDIVAKLGNGILYIYVPKMSKDHLPYDIPVENVSW